MTHLLTLMFVDSCIEESEADQMAWAAVKGSGNFDVPGVSVGGIYSDVLRDWTSGRNLTNAFPVSELGAFLDWGVWRPAASIDSCGHLAFYGWDVYSDAALWQMTRVGIAQLAKSLPCGWVWIVDISVR